jgi:Transglycosylase SLT domain
MDFCYGVLVFFIEIGLIPDGHAGSLCLGSLVHVMWGKIADSVIIAFLALMLFGCAPSADTQNDPANPISISGDAQAAQLLASTEAPATSLPKIFTSPPQGNLPFVRSQPKTVAPFPVVLNRTVQNYVNQYVAQPQGLRQSFRRSSPYMAEMVKVMTDEGLPPDLIYLAFAESGFAPGGDGPWQLSRATARRFGLEVDRWVDERRDPIKSTRAAAEYLATLHDMAGDDWRTTLVAWNNGDACIGHYVRLRTASYEKLMARLPHRTRALMNRFMAVAIIAHHANDYGLDDVIDQQTPHYQLVTVKGGASLASIAAVSHVSVGSIKQANPALLRNRIPPDAENYQIRIPDDELQAELSEF